MNVRDRRRVGRADRSAAGGRRLRPGRPTAPRRLLTALRRSLPPLVVAALLWRFDRRAAAIVAASAGAVLLVVGLAAPQVGRRIDRATARLAAGLASFVGSALAALCWVGAIVPVWALSRLCRTDPLDLGWSTPTSAWSGTRSDRSPSGATTTAARLGAPDVAAAPAAGRRSALRTLLGVVVVTGTCAVLVPAATAGDRGTGTAGAAQVLDLRHATPAADGNARIPWAGLAIDPEVFRQEPWAPELFRELGGVGLAPDSILGARNLDGRGDHVCIEDGRRCTWTPDDPQLTIWFFGGSTTFGVGQRDDRTIPSVVARAAAAEGIGVRALNFGVNGDVNWTGVLRFAEALRSDLDRPDLVVFYDGWNDTSLGMATAMSDRGRTGELGRLPFSDREQRIAGLVQDPLPEDHVVAAGIRLAADQYGTSTAIARRLSATSGVPVVFAWQPLAVTKRPAATDRDHLARIGIIPRYRGREAERYREVLERSGVDAVDLTAALDGVDRPVFFDHGHTNELGAEVVGQALYQQLRPQLEALSSTRPTEPR